VKVGAISGSISFVAFALLVDPATTAGEGGLIRGAPRDNQTNLSNSETPP